MAEKRPMITNAVKEKLTKAGYRIEDMGAVWGKEYVGRYRWFHDPSDTFQDAEESFSEHDAWVCAWHDSRTK